ncbi:transcriptional regulator FnrL [Oceaniglobus roseus]|uniref:transcriptional regulator FnrL n=1 Tax=Oceaniglobus roseus TaxID=1737570 RepID=UPI000C7EDEE1|nr:Crp/Fnr family transcriptional regulator [Kandeliimicrobium roseum]
MNLPLIPADCRACPIRHSAVCASADGASLAILQQVKSYRSYPAGTYLARAGEPLEHLSSLVAGCATISKGFEDGRRQTVGLLLPSDFIGRPGRTRATFDIVALSEVTLCRFERKRFEQLLADTPSLTSRLLEMTLDELEAAQDLAVTLGRGTARERVASFLASLARRQRAQTKSAPLSGAVEVQLPLTRAEIADHLGLTIETVSRQMTGLRKEGIIALENNRTIAIPDFSRLLEAAGADPDD